MSDSPILDGGKRFPDVMTVRLPEGFLDRIKTAAADEGIAPTDFARRAIAERLARGDLDPAGDHAAQKVQAAATPAPSAPAPPPPAAAPLKPSPAPAEGAPAPPSRSRGAWARP